MSTLSPDTARAEDTETPGSGGSVAATRPGFTPRLRVRPFSFREFALAGLAMLVAVVAVMFPHIRGGGFTLDDWSTYSDIVVRGGSLGDDISYLIGQENIRARPLTGVLLATLANVFGYHMGVWIAFAGGLAAVMGTMVFSILRALGLALIPAFAIGAFAVLTPLSDTLRLWAIAGTVQLPISLALAGILLALYAFREQRPRRANLLHAASVLSYAASLLFVETSILLCAGAVVLYLLVAPRRAALIRWVVDVVVLGTIYVFVTSTTSYERQGFGGAIDHTGIIIDQSRQALTTIVFPFGGAGSWYAMLPAVLLLAAAVAVARSLPVGSEDRAGLVRWLWVTVGGIGVLIAGYAPYAFADAYYSPLTVGQGNRTNALATVGWALVLVGLVMLAATLVFRGLPRGRTFVAVAASVMLGSVAISYVDTYRTDAGYYRTAFDTAAATLVTVENSIVDPPADSMIYVSGTPLEAALGIPIFMTTWDLNGALRYGYDRYDIRGLPVFTYLELKCDRRLITPMLSGVPQPGFASEYGKTFFVDGITGQGTRIKSPAECRAASTSWPRNPAQPAPPT